MLKKKGVNPVYPIITGAYNSLQNKGLTKREYFAAMVAAGSSGSPKEIAEHAVWVADALIKALDDTPDE